MTLRSSLIRYAYDNPETRGLLLPLINEFDCVQAAMEVFIPSGKSAYTPDPNPSFWKRILSSFIQHIPSSIRGKMNNVMSSVKDLQDFKGVSAKIYKIADSIEIPNIPSLVTSGIKKAINFLSFDNIFRVLESGWDALVDKVTTVWEKFKSILGFGKSASDYGYDYDQNDTLSEGFLLLVALGAIMIIGKVIQWIEYKVAILSLGQAALSFGGILLGVVAVFGLVYFGKKIKDNMERSNRLKTLAGDNFRTLQDLRRRMDTRYYATVTFKYFTNKTTLSSKDVKNAAIVRIEDKGTSTYVHLQNSFLRFQHDTRTIFVGSPNKTDVYPVWYVE